MISVCDRIKLTHSVIRSGTAKFGIYNVRKIHSELIAAAVRELHLSAEFTLEFSLELYKIIFCRLAGAGHRF